MHEHLIYCGKNSSCLCYWPECNQKAADISDAAFLLFNNLIDSTILYKWIPYPDDYAEDGTIIGTPLSEFFWRARYEDDCPIFPLINQSFWFSHYYRICRDIEEFSKLNFNAEDCAAIKDKIEDMLSELYPKFLSLYENCLAKHTSADIEQEVLFMKLLTNQTDKLYCNQNENQDYFIDKILCKQSIDNSMKSLNTICAKDLLPIKGPKEKYQPFPFLSEILLEQGILCNNLFLYKEAISLFTQAIEKNPNSRDSYIERAMSYFETNQIELAIQDYQSAKKLAIPPPFRAECCMHINPTPSRFTPENNIEYSQGLVVGALDGIKNSVIELVPSICTGGRDILKGVWAFACAPKEVSQEMITASFAIGQFIRSNNANDCFECVVPELRQLSTSWDELTDYSRGRAIGYILGKYGADIFLPVGAIFKGVNKVKALRRANTMLTLELCAASELKKAKILEETVQLLALREAALTKALKVSKILIQNPNTTYHIMQKKHAWEKLIKLTGNVETDFKKVALLLEESDILSKENFLRSKKFGQGKIIRSDYQKVINGHSVQAVFETYVETNLTFLKDAWVITK